MKEETFKTQTFKTQAQWQSGLSYGLEIIEGQGNSGITLYSIPVFTELLQDFNKPVYPGALAVDECGQIYFIDRQTARLYRYNRETTHLELIFDPNAFSVAEKNRHGRILMNQSTLWVLGIVEQKVLAFSRENFQIIYEIENLKQPIDIGMDKNGYIYVLDKACREIIQYDNRGFKIKSFDSSCLLEEPAGLAVGPDNTIYVIDHGCNCFRIFTTDGKYLRSTGNFNRICFRITEKCLKELQSEQFPKSKTLPDDVIKNLKTIQGQEVVGEVKFLNILRQAIGENQTNKYRSKILDNACETFKPQHIAIDKRGVIYVSEDYAGSIHLFDKQGGHLGAIPLFKASVQGLAVDLSGNLYASTYEGIALFIMNSTFTKERGFYYSKALDSGKPDCRWHRLALEADIPEGTVLEVYFYAHNSTKLKDEIDVIIKDSGKSTQEKASLIDSRLSWIGPEKNPEDMLFQGANGRYLWLRIALSTFDETARPSVSNMKVLYPRISYLRYLPAIYQEDLVSREFLERFLSLFESHLYDLEKEISLTHTYFDPDSAPFDADNTLKDFLTWLASWLNLALQEDWSEQMKRDFIRNAPTLYKQKGTPGGIASFIELLTGKRPLIFEHSQLGSSMILDGKIQLGVQSMLINAPVQRFLLGGNSILGRAALRDNEPSPEEPFLPLSHRFTIVLELSQDELERYKKGLTLLLDDEKPAHTIYDLRIIGAMMGNTLAYVGVSTRVTDYPPFRPGISARLGSTIVVSKEQERGRIDEHSRLGIDTRLL